MNKFQILLIFFILAIQFQQFNTKKVKNSDVVYAIDSGSNFAHTTFDGIEYKPDRYFTKENTGGVDYADDRQLKQIQPKFTNEVKIYQTERHGSQTFAYNLPMANQVDGVYVLVLQFCEYHFQEPGKRQMNIKFGKELIINHLDIVERVGPFAALNEFIEFELRNGQIYIKDKLIESAINKKGELNIVFEKTKFDWPKVDALLMIRGTLKDSHQDEYNDMRSEHLQKLAEADRLKELERKKREKARELIQNEFDPDMDTNDHLGFIQGITLLVYEPIGMIIIALLVLFFLCLRLTSESSEEEEQQYKAKYSEQKLSEKKRN